MAILQNARSAAFAIMLLGSIVVPAHGSDKRDDKAIPRQTQEFLDLNDWGKIRGIAEKWSKLPPQKKYAIMDQLAQHLNDVKRSDLVNTINLNVIYRVGRGDMEGTAPGYLVAQDLFIRGGKAAWAIEMMTKAPDLPEIHEGLSDRERLARATEIKRQVALYRQIPDFLTEPSYPKIAATLKQWKVLPLGDQAILVSLLSGQLTNFHHAGLKDNSELTIIGREDPTPHEHVKNHMTLQDLYVARGRAAWAIEEILEFALPPIQEKQKFEVQMENESAIRYAVLAYRAGVEQAARKPPPRN